MSEIEIHTNSNILPNKRGQILLLGIAAFLVGIIGLIAIGKGLDHIGKIRAGVMDPTGKGTIVLGIILGGMGLLVNISLLIEQCMKR